MVHLLEVLSCTFVVHTSIVAYSFFSCTVILHCSCLSPKFGGMFNLAFLCCHNFLNLGTAQILVERSRGDQYRSSYINQNMFGMALLVFSAFFTLPLRNHNFLLLEFYNVNLLSPHCFVQQEAIKGTKIHSEDCSHGNVQSWLHLC